MRSDLTNAPVAANPRTIARNRRSSPARWFREFANDMPAGFRVLSFAASLQLGLLALTAPLYRSAGLAIAWSTVVPHVMLLASMGAMFCYFVWEPGSPRERSLPEAMLVTVLLLLLTNIASPAQYLAVTFRRPLIDAQLARVDAWLGFHVPTLAAWTWAHPVTAACLRIAYSTLLPQFLLPILLLGLWYGDRQRLWEYCFHFHFCLIVTLACLALWPAACAFTHYGFQSAIDQTRFINHFERLRQGNFHLIRLDDVEGLISMPSFHTAGALMVTWVFRGYRRVFYPVALVNVVLVLATFMTGAHYFVDVVATVALFAVSVLVYQYAFKTATKVVEDFASTRLPRWSTAVPDLRV
jgi:PAP2 superfamily protein